jgi:hypothetical protein
MLSTHLWWHLLHPEDFHAILFKFGKEYIFFSVQECKMAMMMKKETRQATIFSGYEWEQGASYFLSPSTSIQSIINATTAVHSSY